MAYVIFTRGSGPLCTKQQLITGLETISDTPRREYDAGLLIFWRYRYMRILGWIERKFGWFAIKNLTLYIVAGNALVWLAGMLLQDYVLFERLALVPKSVFKGEVWRVFTFVLLNSFGGSILTVVLELYFLYMIGSNLEVIWGSFRFTLYYFTGLILTVAVSLIFGIPCFNAKYIHLSLFFAFAQFAPDMQILLFFFIPVKIKWLAWASWAYTAYEFVMAGQWGFRLVILAPLAGFLLFFGPDILKSIRSRRKTFLKQRDYGAKLSKAKVIKAYFHKCEVCGITEKDAPDMDFRYCSKCSGNHEFCMKHLGDHVHHSG